MLPEAAKTKAVRYGVLIGRRLKRHSFGFVRAKQVDSTQRSGRTKDSGHGRRIIRKYMKQANDNRHLGFNVAQVDAPEKKKKEADTIDVWYVHEGNERTRKKNLVSMSLNISKKNFLQQRRLPTYVR